MRDKEIAHKCMRANKWREGKREERNLSSERRGKRQTAMPSSRLNACRAFKEGGRGGRLEGDLNAKLARGRLPGFLLLGAERNTMRHVSGVDELQVDGHLQEIQRHFVEVP